MRQARLSDPRTYQIGVLSILLSVGLLRLDFAPRPSALGLTVVAALATEKIFAAIYQRPHTDLRSPLITALSLGLLLRTSHPVWMATAAFVAIGCKFLLRVDGRHLFNPSNLGIILAVLMGVGWVSPGQWGNTLLFALLLGGAGFWVVTRAARADVTLVFLGSWSLLLFGRSLALGDPPALALHSLRSGSLIVFAFFMITDPKTTPQTRHGRVVFAALVAAMAYVLQFHLYLPHGFLWSLAMLSPLAALRRQLPRLVFRPLVLPNSKGDLHVSTELHPRAPRPPGARPGPGLLRLLRLTGRQPPVQSELSRRPRAAR